MDRATAVAKIEEIKTTAHELEVQVNEAQTELISYIDDLNNSYTRITDELIAEPLIEVTTAKMQDIANKVASAINDSKTILDTLSVDATNEIKNIVDTYNSSITKESNETPLQYEEITLSSVAGVDDIINIETSSASNDNSNAVTNTITDASTIASSNTTSSTNTTSNVTNSTNTSDTISNNGNSNTNTTTNNNSNTTYTSVSSSSGSSNKEITLETFLSYLENYEVDSDKIPGWNNYVSDFLNKNNLSSEVSNIMIKGKMVICELTNAKSIDIENVYTATDLISEINKEL